MKIAILVPTFSKFSGPDRVVEEEAERLAKKHDVTIFALKADMKPRKAKLELLGAPKSTFLERIYRLLFFLDYKKIGRCVKKLREYDKIISFMYPMTLIASKAKKKHGIKYVYYDMGIAYPRLFPKLSERVYLRLFKWLTNKSIRNADKAICISNFLKKELEKETGLKAEVEYVRIDTKRYNKRINKNRAAAIRKKYRIKGPMLLYVGRISPHKGLHLLIKAFRIVNEKIPTAKLVIVGKHTFDDYSKKLKRLANENVVFAGYVPDEELPHYYAACDLYTTATLWEGFDIPACESQAVGKKVVAFDIGSHPEVVKKGMLVKEGDIKGFADAVVKLIIKYKKIEKKTCLSIKTDFYGSRNT
jgi:1,2-diacylglycerol 3-alpha-glucosyltransferase